MAKREGNNTKRRIAARGTVLQAELDRVLGQVRLGQVRYGGSALHKKRPGDYGFIPPVNPRPSKSMCDDIRPVLKAEAQSLLTEGIQRGIVSNIPADGLPKYVWAVDSDQEPYEAKLGEDGQTYHGYRLNKANESIMRDYVLAEWRQRA